MFFLSFRDDENYPKKNKKNNAFIFRVFIGLRKKGKRKKSQTKEKGGERSLHFCHVTENTNSTRNAHAKKKLIPSRSRSFKEVRISRVRGVFAGSRACFSARIPMILILARPFLSLGAFRALRGCVCFAFCFLSLSLSCALTGCFFLSFALERRRYRNNVSSSRRKTRRGESRRCRSATHPQNPHHPLLQKREELGESVLGFDSRRQGKAIEGQRPGSHADEEVASDGS